LDGRRKLSIQNHNSLCDIVSLLMLGTWKHQDFPSCLMVKIQDNQVIYINPMLLSLFPRERLTKILVVSHRTFHDASPPPCEYFLGTSYGHHHPPPSPLISSFCVFSFVFFFPLCRHPQYCQPVASSPIVVP
jgi:hypothetical protein